MKLARENIYAASLLLVTSSVLISQLTKNETSIEEPIAKNTSEINYFIRNDNQINYDEEFNNYYVVNSTEKIGNSYKVLRFIDSNNYYKVMFVITYVGYDINSTAVYSVCDMVTKEELFKVRMVNRYIDINTSYSKNEYMKNAKILSYDELTDLNKYKYMDGIDEEIITSILPLNIENRSITDDDMLEIYKSLIPENLRVNLDYNKKLVR